jgi:hypothetical protein
VRAAADGVSELGMSSRPLNTEETQQLEQFLMARDALAIIVHPRNLVQALSRSQIRDIFAGRLTRWDALGGAVRHRRRAVRADHGAERRRPHRRPPGHLQPPRDARPRMTTARPISAGGDRVRERVAFGCIWAAALLTIAVLALIISVILWRGLPGVSRTFLTGVPGDMGRGGGILPTIVGTVAVGLLAR